MTKKPIKADRKSGEKRDRDTRRWARNGETARYCNVSGMTLWRWKKDKGFNFPAAANINGLEFNDLDKVDAWMESHISEQGGDE